MIPLVYLDEFEVLGVFDLIQIVERGAIVKFVETDDGDVRIRLDQVNEYMRATVKYAAR